MVQLVYGWLLAKHRDNVADIPDGGPMHFIMYTPNMDYVFKAKQAAQDALT